MNRTRTCGRCGTVVPANAPDNLCLRCLFDTADDPDESGARAETPARPGLSSIDQNTPPPVFGDYELLGELGRGGQGVVYRARHRGLGRLVALKTIPPVHLAARHARERFRLEASSASRLDYPNIVPIYEVGERDGFCFYSMKLVEGPTLQQFIPHGVPDAAACRDNAGMLIKVAHAVYHAHQRGVLHRDLKPSNILLDQENEPHVSDFGLARLTGEDSSLTLSHAMIGTPAYLSPEIATGGMHQATVAADIYGLGAILYQLLTGQPPFVRPTMVETLRAVQDQEPPRPAKLNPAVPADLETICLKCLEKEPGKRYATAQELAGDLERFLRDEPITARPASMAYRFRKAYRRNKLAFTAAAAVALALIAGTILSTWQALEASRARDAEKEQRLAAQTERDAKAAALKEAEAISTFLTGVLQSPDPARNGATLTIAEMLGMAAKKLETDLASQPARRAKLQTTLGRTYFTLGLMPDAIPLQEKALDYCRIASGPEHPDTLEVMKELAFSYYKAERWDDSLKLREAIFTLSRKVLGPEHPDTLTAMGYLARSYNVAGRVGEAFRLNEEALTLSRKVNGQEHPDTLRAMRYLAESYSNTGRPEEALKRHEEALALHRKVLGPENLDTLFAMSFVAESYCDASRPDEAIKLMTEVVAVRRKVLGPQHPDTLSGMSVQAECYSLAGRTDDALKLREEVLSVRRKVFGPEYPVTLYAMQNLADSYDQADRRAEALKLREEMVTVRRKVLGPKHPDTLDAMQNLARSYSRAGRKDEAFKVRDEALSGRNAQLALRTAGFPAIRATLVAPDSEWRWLHPTDGKDPAEALPGFHKAFFLPAFDDSEWTRGRDKGGLFGGFGYGDLFDGVDIKKAANPAHRHTAYFRHAFTTDAKHDHLELRCQRDDGIIVYLDGQQVIRDNVGPGDEAYLLPSTTGMGVENDLEIHRFKIRGALAPGNHILAISVHNTERFSSDLYLGGVTLVAVEPFANDN